MTVAIIYAAKSTEDTRGSIPTQLGDCRAMAEHEGWTVAHEFSDEAKSAWKGDRGPGLKAACEMATVLAAEHGSCVLVAQHSDRFARGDGRQARHLGELLFWAMKIDVELRSVQDDSTFTNPLLAFAMGERNAEDSRRKSLAVKSGMARRAARGKPTGGPAPYGYRWEGPKFEQCLVVEPAEAEIVKRIYAEFAAGQSQLAITRSLNEEGIRTKRGREWSQGTIAKILANPNYIGELRHHGETYRGDHEPIVDEAAWRRCEQLREAGRKSPGARGKRPVGNHLFLKGMLRCGECGSAMVPRTIARPRSEAYEVYYCLGQKEHGPDHCSQKPIRRQDIDRAALAYFEQTGLDVDATRRQVEEATDRKLAEIRALGAQVQKDRAQRLDARARIEADYIAGALSAARYEALSARLEAEGAALAAQEAQLTAQEAQTADNAALGDAEAAMLTYLTEIRATIAGDVQNAAGIEAVRAALAALFEHFYVHGPSLWPVLRKEAIGGYVDDGSFVELGHPGGPTRKIPLPAPVPRRIPLAYQANTYADAFTR